ncbi:MAG: hypothetical protein GX896_07105 [Clostridiales bacterium]|nr:hypothetical protein [Clostridiales bacterium]
MKVIKRYLAAALAVMICCMALINPANTKIENALATPVDTQISDYQKQLDDLKQKSNELNSQINKNKDNIDSEKENQKLLDSQIQNTYDNIALRNSYITKLEDDIATLDNQIVEAEDAIELRQIEIDNGIEGFGKRLRAMYISGQNGYADIVLDAGDFYDSLMRLELVQRVADNDNKMIDTLTDLKKQQEAEVVALENKKKDLSDNMTTYSNEITELEDEKLKLEDLYSQSEKSLESLQKWQADYLAQQAQVNSDTSAASNKLDALKQQKLLEEYERKQAEEQRRKQAEEASKNNYTDNGGKGANTNGSSNAALDNNVTYSKDIAPVLDMARKMVGGRYVWGAESPTATDCSGLVLQCYRKIGISLPHKASVQANYGRVVSYGDMKPGDLIFYGGSSYSSIYHVAIYIGGGKIIHAESTRTGIVVSYASNVASSNHVTVVKRLVE